MGSSLSNDLRWRVVQAIEGGLSRRAAALKFEVSIASAVRWHQRYKRTGTVEPDKRGGDRHSHRAEAHSSLILFWIDETPDITIPQIRERLIKRGHTFSKSALWRLIKRHDYTVKKRQAMQGSKSARM